MRCSPVSPSSGTLFDVFNKRKERDRLTALMGGPGFWDNQEKAQQIIAQLKPLNPLVNEFNALESSAADLNAQITKINFKLWPTLLRITSPKTISAMP